MLIFDLGQLRHRVETIYWVGPLTVSSTSANDRIYTRRLETIVVLASQLRRRERTNKIPNVGQLCKFPWAY